MDDADRASEREEHEKALTIQAAIKPSGPKPKGFCYWCEEPTAAAFCCGDCRDEWEYDRERKRAQGL